MSKAAGYSGTPLAQKLGIKPGFRIRTTNAPSHYEQLIDPAPDGASFSSRFRSEVDMCHIFTRLRRELSSELQRALAMIRPHGMIWVSWPKKSSGVASEVSEDIVRQVALPLGLVDVKVCAVDDTWSGLKLVIRRSQRSEQ